MTKWNLCMIGSKYENQSRQYTILGYLSFYNKIKSIYKNSTANIILNSQRLRSFPLYIRNKTRCSLSLLLLNIVLKILAKEIWQEKEIQNIQIGKEELKLFLFQDDMIKKIENYKKIHGKLLDIISKISKLKDTSSIYKYHLQLCTLAMSNPQIFFYLESVECFFNHEKALDFVKYFLCIY